MLVNTLELVGVGLIVAGLVLVSVPLALVVAGLILVIGAYSLDQDEPNPAEAQEKQT